MGKNKIKKLIIYTILVFVVGNIVGGIITYSYFNSINLKEEISNNDKSIKLSKYTLDELYEVVENPNMFYMYNFGTRSIYSYTMFHFYDYFSDSTPVKVATKVRRDEDGNVVEVLDVKYINYEEYNDIMEKAYENEERLRIVQNNNDMFVEGIDYSEFVENLIYP